MKHVDKLSINSKLKRGAGAGFMDGSICYRIEVNVASISIMSGASFGIPMVIAFNQKSIGGVAVGKFSLQNDL